MGQYTVTLTDLQDQGLAGAADDYNKTNTPEVPLTPSGYLNMVLSSAADSYVTRFVREAPTVETVAVLENKLEVATAAAVDMQDQVAQRDQTIADLRAQLAAAQPLLDAAAKVAGP